MAKVEINVRIICDSEKKISILSKLETIKEVSNCTIGEPKLFKLPDFAYDRLDIANSLYYACNNKKDVDETIDAITNYRENQKQLSHLLYVLQSMDFLGTGEAFYKLKKSLNELILCACAYLIYKKYSELKPVFYKLPYDEVEHVEYWLNYCGVK